MPHARPKMPEGPKDLPNTPREWSDPEFTKWVEDEGILTETRRQYRNAHRDWRDHVYQTDRWSK